VERFSIADAPQRQLPSEVAPVTDLGQPRNHQNTAPISPMQRRSGAGLKQSSSVSSIRSQDSHSNPSSPHKQMFGGARRYSRQQPQQRPLAGPSGASAMSAAALAPPGGGGASVAINARLTRENEALRGALGQAVRRLSELEGEQERFLAEGVFDLVNSICGSAAGAPAGPEAVAQTGPQPCRDGRGEENALATVEAEAEAATGARSADCGSPPWTPIRGAADRQVVGICADGM